MPAEPGGGPQEGKLARPPLLGLIEFALLLGFLAALAAAPLGFYLLDPHRERGPSQQGPWDLVTWIVDLVGPAVIYVLAAAALAAVARGLGFPALADALVGWMPEGSGGGNGRRRPPPDPPRYRPY
jgi:hypothetical protein